MLKRGREVADVRLRHHAGVPGGEGARVKRRNARAPGRIRLVITQKVDRSELMLRDPDKYFADARARALAEVRREGQPART